MLSSVIKTIILSPFAAAIKGSVCELIEFKSTPYSSALLCQTPMGLPCGVSSYLYEFSEAGLYLTGNEYNLSDVANPAFLELDRII